MVPSIRSFRGSSRPPQSYKSPQLSPTLTATTSASALDLGEEGPRVIITRADLRDSISAYEQLLATATAYRNALISMSAASTALAGALGECARVKGAGESGEQLLAASGLHYMLSNSGQVLSDTLYRSFEVPLMTAYDSYVSDIAQRHADYEALLTEKTAKIRETEAENMRQGKKKTRDLNQFRQALAKLTEQVAEVEVCKRSYYSEVLASETEMWGHIEHKVSLLLRSTLDLADRLASKATSDPVIESMLDEHPDPFDSYRLETDEARDVFTVLPPMNLGLAGGAAAAGLSSKKAAPVDSDMETVRSKERERQPSHEGSTPVMSPSLRREPLKTPVSVSDVLGLTDAHEDHATRVNGRRRPTQDDTEESPPRSITSLSRNSSQAPAPHALSSIPSSSSTTPSPASLSDSPALNPEETDSTFEPPSLTTESAPFVTASAVSGPTSPRRPGRRRLSKVAETEPADPMAGDWSAPVYGGTLSRGMNGGNGYDSGEVSLRVLVRSTSTDRR
ncbi:hypothetical protein JCM1841_000897 [Sporobolomyces salmonicolor]